MSVEALYRVIVRMLYDPALVEAVYREPGAALEGAGLRAEELDWLRAGEMRAWRTDPMRRARFLTTLIEEFPVSAACALRRMREGVVRVETELLDAFFSSPGFHQGLQAGSAIVFGFGHYLEGAGHGGVAADPRIAPLARLEASIARLRRIEERSLEPRPLSPESPAGRSPAARYRLAPWAELLRGPSGAAELHARISKALQARTRGIVANVLDRQWSLPVLLEFDPDVEEHILVERPPVPGLPWMEAGVRQAPVTPELAGLLRVAATGATWGELAAAARALGADPGEDEDVVAGLVGEGLLVRTG